MILVALTLVEIWGLTFQLLRRRLLLLPDLHLLVSGLLFVMVARSKERTTMLGDRRISKLMKRPELPVVPDPRGTAKIESEIGTTGVNLENNRLKNPSVLVSDWEHSNNLYVNIFKKLRRNVHSWLISNQKWKASRRTRLISRLGSIRLSTI